MKKFVRNYYLSFMGSFAKPRNGVYILNGHYLTACDIDFSTSMADDFLDSLESFAKLINIEDAISMIKNNVEDKVFDNIYIAFTFDDGFEECYTHIAKSLEKRGVNAAFFINPNFVAGSTEYCQKFTDYIVKTPGKKPMTWEQIKALSDRGFIIGNHTLDHCRLNINDEAILQEQVLMSKYIIEKKLGIKCDYFAWTYGAEDDISKEALEYVKKVHKYVFSGCQYRRYFFNNDNKVFNRRHCEFDWDINHLVYFLSKGRTYGI